jgi:murein DD-endopeptidase MepM/ murein hydrolase activator NlpD
MNNQRFQAWRLRFSLWVARQRLRWQNQVDQWRVPVVITNRWFVLGAYFLVVLLLSIAWFARPFSFWQAGPPGDSQPPASVTVRLDDDIAPPVLPTYPESQASRPPADESPNPQPPKDSGGGVIVSQGEEGQSPGEQPAEEQNVDAPLPGSSSDQPDSGQPEAEQSTGNPPKAPTTQDQPESAAFAAGVPTVSITLQYPLEGDISVSNPYALVSRQTTLNDWRPHLAVDFAAPQGSKVLAAAAGKVKHIFQEDILWGTGVVLEHGKNCTTAYMDLDQLTVEVGERVNAGQQLGVLKGSPPVEQMDISHLHFVLTIDGEDVDPTELFR